MLLRPVISIAFACCFTGLIAQVPFTWSVVTDEPGRSIGGQSVRPLASDTYRLSGNGSDSTSAFHWQADLDANGIVTNGVRIPLVIASNVYQQVLLDAADGGQLLTYLWVAGGTDQQAFLRTDATGEVLWYRLYPDNYGKFFNDGQHTLVEKDGGYFILGHDQATAVNEGYASLMLHLDSLGAAEELWTYNAGDSWSEAARALFRTASNGLAAFWLQRPYFSNASFPRITAQRWNAAMQLEWSRAYSFGSYHDLFVTTPLADGGYLLGGMVRTTNLDPFTPFLCRLDSTGGVLWGRRIQGPAPIPVSAVEAADGTFTLLARDNFTQQHTPVIARLTADGALIEAHRMDVAPGTFIPLELVIDSVNGEHLARMAGPSGNTLFRLDALLRTTCGDAPYTWTDTLVMPTVEEAPLTITTSMLISEEINTTPVPMTFRTLDPCLSTGIAEAPVVEDLQAWPIPAASTLTVALPSDARTGRTRIMDASGRVLRDGAAAAQSGTIQLDVSALPAGCYLFAWTDAKGTRFLRWAKE